MFIAIVEQDHSQPNSTVYHGITTTWTYCLKVLNMAWNLENNKFMSYEGTGIGLCLFCRNSDVKTDYLPNHKVIWRTTRRRVMIIMTRKKNFSHTMLQQQEIWLPHTNLSLIFFLKNELSINYNKLLKKNNFLSEVTIYGRQLLGSLYLTTQLMKIRLCSSNWKTNQMFKYMCCKFFTFLQTN